MQNLVVKTQILSHAFLILQWTLFPYCNKDWDYIGASSMHNFQTKTYHQLGRKSAAVGLCQCLVGGSTHEKTVVTFKF